MNANELADELDYCYGKEYPCPVSKEAATMLRQQQSEILAGKIMIKGYGKTIDEQQTEISLYKLELTLHRAMIQDLENALKKEGEK